jgi:Family of unknown function (DUF6088)
MKTLPEAILDCALGSLEGQILSPKEFLHMGNRTAVDKALSRLSKNGRLIRVERGAYVAPLRGQVGCTAPSAEKVVESLASLSGESIALDGAASAVAFGLAQPGQTPLGYLTSGRSRTLLLGTTKVMLRHAPSWMLALGNGSAGAAVRTMAWLGPTAAEAALVKIRASLNETEWLALMACRAVLPSWMARLVGESGTGSPKRQPKTLLNQTIGTGMTEPKR